MTWKDLIRALDMRGVGYMLDGPSGYRIMAPRPRLAIDQKGVVVRGELAHVADAPSRVRVVLDRGGGKMHAADFDRDENVFALLDGGPPPCMAGCPRCGDPGEWRAMALVCRKGCGAFVGGPL